MPLVTSTPNTSVASTHGGRARAILQRFDQKTGNRRLKRFIPIFFWAHLKLRNMVCDATA